MASRFVLPFADVGNGISPADGAKLEFFAAGTSTQKDTFSDEALIIKNANPVIANGDGVFPDIFLPDGGRYKVTLDDKNIVQKLEADPVVGAVSAALSSKTLDTVALMVASIELNIGDIVETAGYITKGDGGDNRYEIVAAATGTDDGGSFIDLTGITGQAKGLFPEDAVNVKQFGARGDGATNDTTALVSAFAFIAANSSILFFPAGTYLSDSIVIPANIEMYGNRSKSIIKTNAGQDNHALILTSVTDVSIHDLTIDQNRANNTLGHGIRIESSSDIDIYNMNIIETAGFGIGAQVGTLREISIRNVLIDGTVNDGIDFKNLNDDNENLHFTDITIKNFGSVTGKAGIDIRGPALLENIYVEINANNSVGIRFRVDDLGGTGVGGRRSSMTNSRVRRLAGTGTTGVITNGQHVKIANAWVEDTAAGFSDLVGKCAFVNCVAFQCTADGFSVAGNRSSFVNCYANQCNIGFDVTGDSNQFSSPSADASVAEGFRFQAGGDNNSITGGELVGNGTKITDSGSGNVVRHLLGFVNETNLVTGSLAIDSTGSRIFVIAHGLDKVPSVANVQLTMLIQTTVTDFAVDFLRVETIDATNITGQLNIGTASGTGAATCKVNISIHA